MSIFMLQLVVLLKIDSIWLIWFIVLNATFSNISAISIMATSFSGGRSRSTRREPLTIGKQLVNFITCSCESIAPFFVIYKANQIESIFNRTTNCSINMKMQFGWPICVESHFQQYFSYNCDGKFYWWWKRVK
jgi:hypothetical protein